MEAREGESPPAAGSAAAVTAAQRSENPSQSGAVLAPAPAVAQDPVAVPGLVGPPKKKRGRPRKYAPDGSTISLALSPMPISTSAPAVAVAAGVGAGAGPAEFSGSKRGRGRPAGSLNKPRVELDYSGEWAGCSVGGNFTPHIINVPAGEDVTMKIISFSQQGPRAICILSANGAISNVTLRQPDSSGGTLTYEGRFEILSLSGSFMPTENKGARSRSGGMSVSLASPDGRVVGGGVAGLLIAASPVQVVIGSFIPYVPEQKPKKLKAYPNICSMPTPATPVSSADMDDSYVVQARVSTTRPDLTTSSYRGESWATLHPMAETRNSSSSDINVSLPGE